MSAERAAPPAWTRGDQASSILLGVGLALTTATKLRVAGLPLGPAEALLLVWLFEATCRIVWDRTVWVGGVAWAVLTTWVALLGGLFLGFGTAIAAGRADLRHTRDFFAFGLAAVLVGAFVVRPWVRRRLWVTTQALVAALLAMCAALLALGVLGARNLVFYGGVRFAGLAENPNQLALVLAPVPFLCLWFRRRAAGWRRARFTAALVAAGVFGVLTASDALALAWLASSGTLVAWAALRWAAVRWRSGRPVAQLGVLVAATGAAAVMLVLVPPVTRAAERYARAVEGEGNQASVREVLWQHGLEAIARSPVVGWGPGAHSGLVEPFTNAEAHNTFIDAGMNGGAVAVAAYLGYLAWVGYGLARRREAVGLAGLVAVALFACFHYVLRQPAFWFMTLGLAVLGRGAVGQAEALRRPAARP